MITFYDSITCLPRNTSRWFTNCTGNSPFSGWLLWVHVQHPNIFAQVSYLAVSEHRVYHAHIQNCYLLRKMMTLKPNSHTCSGTKPIFHVCWLYVSQKISQEKIPKKYVGQSPLPNKIPKISPRNKTSLYPHEKSPFLKVSARLFEPWQHQCPARAHWVQPSPPAQRCTFLVTSWKILWIFGYVV